MVGRKGVFFTATAILMIAVFIFSFFVYKEYSMRNKALVIETRITSMDDFMKDAETDVERGVYISGFRSILALIESISVNESYLDDFELRFEEVFFNGTVRGEEMSLVKNNTFSDWMSKIQTEAAKIGIVLYFYNNTVKAWQDDPWSISIGLNFTLGVEDSKNTAFWAKEMEVKTQVSIINMEDPIYRIETSGVVFNVVMNAIRKQNENFIFVNPNTNSTENLTQHVDGSYYIHRTSAPSFMQRMEGDFSANPNGIESLINVQKLIDQSIPPKTKSIIDYIYFSDNNPTYFSVGGNPPMPEWFRLDNLSNHLQVYNVTEIII